MCVFSQKLTKRRNLSLKTTVGMANDSAIVPDWNLALSVALRAYLSDFYIDNGSSMRALILYFILNLAFLLSVSSPEFAGYLFCFMVFKFNDVLPLRKDSVVLCAFKISCRQGHGPEQCGRLGLGTNY
jgi:hypothetical protein